MRVIIFYIILLIFVPIVSANYADLEIEVGTDGLVTVQGTTNIDSLLIEDDPTYTSKKGPYWLFNYTTNVTFDDVVYSISLPEHAVVNYMKLPSFGRIEDDAGITISGVAEDSSLSLVVQYTIQYPKDAEKQSNTWIFGIVFICLLVVFITYYIRRIKAENRPQSIDLSRYSTRQATILQLLLDHDGELTQAQLEKKTGFPKSSLSRNIASLQRKGVVEKFNKGMTNSIRVKVR